MAEISIFTPFLRSGRRRSGRRAVVLDGGLATELERMGKDLAGVRAARKPQALNYGVLGVHGYMQRDKGWNMQQCCAKSPTHGTVALEQCVSCTHRARSLLSSGLAPQGSHLSAQDDLWSARVLMDDPAAVEAVHLSYYRAGLAPPGAALSEALQLHGGQTGLQQNACTATARRRR